MWYLVRNDLMSIVEGKDNDSLCLCNQIGRFLDFCRALYHKHSVQEKWYSFWPCMWSWKEPQSYKPTIPDPSSSLTSEPESETNTNRNSSTKSETNANRCSGTKLKRDWVGTWAWFLNNHESELEHQSERKANQILSMKTKRASNKNWTWIGTRASIRMQLRSHKMDLRWKNTVSSTYIWMGRYNHSLSLYATNMVSKNCPIIGEHHFFYPIGYHSNSMTS